MSSNLIKCSLCHIAEDSIAYYCCNQQEVTCCKCSKQFCSKCDKKRSKVYKSINAQVQNYYQKIVTCVFCMKKFHGDYIQFQCHHQSCKRCLSKKIQEKIKHGIWQPSFKKGHLKKLSYCSCDLWKAFDVTQFLEKHCMCCGQQLLQNMPVLLKYNLRMKQNCRNKMLFQSGLFDILNKDDIENLTNYCKTCSKIIDGYINKMGFQGIYTCECKKCFYLFQNQQVQQKANNQKKLVMSSCIACQLVFSQKDMVQIDGQFNLCKNCQKQTKNKQSQIMVQQPQIFKQEQLIIKQKGSNEVKILKDDFMKQKNNQNKLQNSVKNKYGINLNEKIQHSFAKKISFQQKGIKNCVICFGDYQQQIKDSYQQIQICRQCYENNNKVQMKKINQSPHRSRQHEQIPIKSSRQHNNWRLNVDYKTFLKSSDQLNFQKIIKKQVNNPQQQKMKRRFSKDSNNNGRYAMYSIIQQIPDADFINIVIPQQHTVNCNYCGYMLGRESFLEHRGKELCLGCFMVAQSKND